MESKRRSFIKKTGLLGFTSALGLSKESQALADKEVVDFPKAVCSGTTQKLDTHLDILWGSLPDDIYGHCFIMESVNTKEQLNLSASQGAIVRVDFNDTGASVKKRALETPSVVVKNALEGTRHSFKPYANLFYMSFQVGLVNFCNTAFCELPDSQLAATYDAGVPYLINPKTLEVVTPIGAKDEWDGVIPKGLEKVVFRNWPFKFVRSTAHPRFDEQTNDFFSVNFSMGIPNSPIGGLKARLNLVKWGLSGALEKWEVVDARGRSIAIKGAVHSMCISRNFIVIVDSPFKIEYLKVLGLTNRGQAASPDTTLWIIDRNNIDEQSHKVKAVKCILNKEWQHIECDYEDDGSELTLIGASSPASDFSECVRQGERFRESRSKAND